MVWEIELETSVAKAPDPDIAAALVEFHEACILGRTRSLLLSLSDQFIVFFLAESSGHVFAEFIPERESFQLFLVVMIIRQLLLGFLVDVEGFRDDIRTLDAFVSAILEKFDSMTRLWN